MIKRIKHKSRLILRSLKYGLRPKILLFRKRSYSQSGEDLIIDFIFREIGIHRPSYLDIGAHHPFDLNNTQIFYEKGSRGINVEPDPTLFKQFSNYRKKDVNVNCGVGPQVDELDLHIMNAATLNTFSSDEAERLVREFGFAIEKKIKIKVHSIQSLLNQYHNGVFPDFLTLDVEGLDEAIIKSIDFTQSKPIVICLETISYSATGHGVKNYEIVDYLKEKGYMVYADTNINTILVLQEKWQRN